MNLMQLRFHYAILKQFVLRIKNRVLDVVRNEKDSVEELFLEHNVLLSRVNSLSNYQYHRDVFAADFRWLYLPSYQNVATAPRIQLTKLAFEYIYSSASESVTKLLSDLGTWRRFLGDTNSLIAKMVFIRVVHSHLSLLSDFIANEPMDSNLLIEIEKSLLPMNQGEINFCKVMQTETEFILGMIRQGGMWRDSVYQRIVRRLSFPFMSSSVLNSSAQWRNTLFCQTSMLSPVEYIVDYEKLSIHPPRDFRSLRYLVRLVI